MKQIRIIGCLCILLAGLPAAARAGIPADQLKAARTFVEQKDYARALEIYQKNSDGLAADPDLLIEWARVDTYADRHPEAIKLFEEVRKKYPEREKDILRELGDQYKWNGQLAAAIEVYRRALTQNPADQGVTLGLAQALAWDNRHQEAIREYDRILARDSGSVPALLGKAEVLSWDDKLEQADKIYAKVLELEPQNLNARNGLARNAVWQGYHRRGIVQYQRILKDFPDNPDSLEGLAFAYHWSGQDTLALGTVERLLARYPQRSSARDLYDQIRGLERLHVSQSGRYSEDSNKLAIWNARTHAGELLKNATALGTTYEWASYRQPGQPALKAERGGVDVQKRWNEFWETNSYVYLSKYSANEFTPVTSNTWVTLYPNDLWRFDLAYDRETFEDITSLQNKIIVNSGSLSADFKPDRFWLFSTKYKGGRYSDDNTQNTIFSRIEFRLKQTPYVKLYFNDYYSRWGEQLNHGYFNPRTIHSDVLGVYASRQLNRRLFLEGQASGGYEKQDPKSDHPTYFAALGLVYRLHGNWSVSARAEYFKAQDANPAKEYSKETYWLGLNYNFGPEPKRTYEGQQSQRPVNR